MKTINHSLMALLLCFGLFSAQILLAAEDSPHKVVIQVSTDDPQTQKTALNNAVNLQKALGQDNVEIEVVAYGPGLSLLTSNSSQGKRVTSLAMQDIKFSACGNTIRGIERKTGKKPELLEGVTMVEAGVLRLVELHEQGYTYVRP
ncbi:DsrE family protein [Sedimenticola thiotaurini]|uniref:Uncharacterized protein n=1 Tax=Sedimenticola thiotaurini TaxID=1543721 RepID=A0A0F7JY01_9GAMM|nr:DsrE family protein [Sedimenticola thiotaurini]AKH21296.1 hypothetical protein AAY24_14020 [Sedimenticola thiotaurini]